MGEVFKKESCKAGEIYDNILKILEKAGWENISSDKSIDFDVMHSKGENGDRDLYIQLRPWATNATQDVRTTNNKNAGMRLLKGYNVPLNPVVETQDIELNGEIATVRSVGIVDRPNAPWHIFWLSGNISVVPEAEVEYYYLVNKDYLILIIRHLSTLPTDVTLHYIGLPNISYIDIRGNTGLIWASSQLHGGWSGKPGK